MSDAGESKNQEPTGNNDSQNSASGKSSITASQAADDAPMGFVPGINDSLAFMPSVDTDTGLDDLPWNQMSPVEEGQADSDVSEEGTAPPTPPGADSTAYITCEEPTPTANAYKTPMETPMVVDKDRKSIDENEDVSDSSSEEEGEALSSDEGQVQSNKPVHKPQQLTPRSSSHQSYTQQSQRQTSRESLTQGSSESACKSHEISKTLDLKRRPNIRRRDSLEEGERSLEEGEESSSDGEIDSVRTSLIRSTSRLSVSEQPIVNTAAAKPVISTSIEDSDGELVEEVDEIRVEKRDEVELHGINDDEFNSDREEGEQLSEAEVDGREAGEVCSDDGEIVSGEEGQICGEEGQIMSGEEGEISDDKPALRWFKPKRVCKYYQTGTCFSGRSCQFLHPGVNDSGFLLPVNHRAPPPPTAGPMGPRFMGRPPFPGPPQMTGPRPPMGPRPEFDSPEMFEAPAPPEPPANKAESIWASGLRKAKEALRKAQERKETDPELHEKKMTLAVAEKKATPPRETPAVPTDRYSDDEDWSQRDPYSSQYGNERPAAPPDRPPADRPNYPDRRPPQQAGYYDDRRRRNDRMRRPMNDDRPRRPDDSRERSPGRRYNGARDRRMGPDRDDEVRGRGRGRGRPRSSSPRTGEKRGGRSRPNQWNDPWMRAGGKKRSRSRSASSSGSYSSSSSYSSHSGSSDSSYSSSSRSSSSSSLSSSSRSPSPRPRARPAPKSSDKPASKEKVPPQKTKAAGKPAPKPRPENKPPAKSKEPVKSQETSKARDAVREKSDKSDIEKTSESKPSDNKPQEKPRSPGKLKSGSGPVRMTFNKKQKTLEKSALGPVEDDEVEEEPKASSAAPRQKPSPLRDLSPTLSNAAAAAKALGVKTKATESKSGDKPISNPISNPVSNPVAPPQPVAPPESAVGEKRVVRKAGKALRTAAGPMAPQRMSAMHARLAANKYSEIRKRRHTSYSSSSGSSSDSDSSSGSSSSGSSSGSSSSSSYSSDSEEDSRPRRPLAAGTMDRPAHTRVVRRPGAGATGESRLQSRVVTEAQRESERDTRGADYKLRPADDRNRSRDGPTVKQLRRPEMNRRPPGATGAYKPRETYPPPSKQPRVERDRTSRAVEEERADRQERVAASTTARQADKPAERRPRDEAAPIKDKKKPSISKRDELIKQLKSVEDAIARKRSKIN